MDAWGRHFWQLTVGRRPLGGGGGGGRGSWRPRTRGVAPPGLSHCPTVCPKIPFEGSPAFYLVHVEPNPSQAEWCPRVT